MTQQEQRAFVSELVETVKNSILHDVQFGKVPTDWNGIELRWLIAARFAAEQNGKPTKDYKNEVLVRNL